MPVPPTEVSAELLEGFLAEAEDYLNTIGRTLPALRERPAERELLQTVRRCVHTLKGAAAIVGRHAVAQLAHRMEDLLDALYAGQLLFTDPVHDLLFATFDMLDDFIRDQRAQDDLDQTTLALYQTYAAFLDDVPPDATTAPAVAAASGDHASGGLETPPADCSSATAHPPAEIVEPDTAVTEPLVEHQPPEQQDTSGPAVRRRTDVVRVPIDRIDELVRLVSELVISRSVYEQHLGRLSRQVDELRLSMDRLRRVATTVETQLQGGTMAGAYELVGRPVPMSPLRHEFDALEFEDYSELQLLARELSETTADFGALEQEFEDIHGDFDSYLTRHGRLTSEMQDKLMRLRMVPLATLATRLHRAVRVTARQQGKDVELHLVGEEVEFDKIVLEEMAEPLLHLLRNAVDHGIEPPALRQALGKAPCGQVQLRAFTEGTQVVIQVSDDGSGLDPQLLRAAAVRGGFVAEAEAAQLTQEQLYALVFTPSFSTTHEVSEISGRGVGMDIVHATVSRLKGSVELTSTPGQGVTCTMRLPLTLAIARVLLVKTHAETFAIPLADVTRVLRLDAEAIEQVGNTPVLRVDGQVVPVVRLGDKLRLRQPAESSVRRVPVVVTQVGERQVAFVVDEILGGREVVVKTLGNHLRRVHGIIGSTLMGDGSIVLILHVSELMRDDLCPPMSRSSFRPAPSPRAVEIPEVLIVDDSFSVRRVVANFVRSAGWHPVLAKDGLEALEIIQRAPKPPDVILLDIEMPQMDGYELTSTLRAHPTYRHIPIVMLTSRAGEKHRQKAFEVGATEYLVKPYQDEVLLNLIRRLVPHAGGITAA